jgi:hypothetical protein
MPLDKVHFRFGSKTDLVGTSASGAKRSFDEILAWNQDQLLPTIEGLVTQSSAWREFAILRRSQAFPAQMVEAQECVRQAMLEGSKSLESSR